VLGHLTSHLTHQNVLPLFLQASQRSITPLREVGTRALHCVVESIECHSNESFQACERYFVQHSPAIVDSTEWKELKRMSMQHAFDLLEYLAKWVKSEDTLVRASTHTTDNQLPMGDSQPLTRPIKRSHSQAGSNDDGIG